MFTVLRINYIKFLGLSKVMHWINHFFFSVNLLILFFRTHLTFGEIILFTVLFALFIDFDFMFRRYLRGNKKDNLRTWIQEPFGILLFAAPIALLFSILNPIYFWVIITAFSSHVLLDYCTVRTAFPLKPFSKKPVRVGFIGKINFSKKKPRLRLKSISEKFDENHFLVLNLALFIYLYTKFY